MIDRLKPRFRKDTGLTKKLVTTDFFKVFKKKHKKTDIKDFAKAREILKSFHNKVTDIIATEREGFNFMNMAYIFTVGFYPSEEDLQSKKLYINHNLSNQIDKKVIYSNIETDGKVCKIFFSMDLPKYKFKFRKIWGFTPTRPFKKKVSESFKINHQKFFTFHKNVPRQLAFKNLNR